MWSNKVTYCLFSVSTKGNWLSRNFSLHKLSESHSILQKLCRDFAEKELMPIASQLDREHKFPEKQINKMGELGLLSINVSKKYGGAGLDTLSLALAVEEISKGCAGTGAIVSIHNCLYGSLMDSLGNHEQKEKFLRPLINNSHLGCFALSEPDAGSDVVNMSCTATRDGTNFILNGRKSWVTSASQGKVAVIFATIDKNLKHKGITAFIVPLSLPGVTIGKEEDKLGIRASSTCDVILEDVQIPQENVLGQIGDGFKIAMSQLDKARIGIAAQAVGIAQAALDLAVGYSLKRTTSGKPICQLDAVKMRLADMSLRLESARLLVWRAAICCDEQQRTTKESSMAKLFASETATFVTHSAIQILGGMGYVSDMSAERHYRDARITEIYGGVSDVHRIIIGEQLVKNYK
ncbi:unnamed protein product [Phyllotreta striolata]|uniref:Short-chain specific acyl-CoA dehydrogenase, mitochondrial n=1 Tax=Phyllotreta striolata TaxID=444603 RepID=A0A9N9TKS1_PHYSR|nr:unnamed protein product [Phyllotreta striolata]